MNQSKKQYGRFSLNELRAYIDSFNQLKSEGEELDQLTKEKEILGKLDPPYCWADVYSTTFAELIEAFAINTGQSQLFIDIANSHNPQQSALNYSNQANVTDLAIPGDPKETLLLLNAITKNLLSICTLNYSLCEIVDLIRKNPQSSLFFKAIKIDKTIINNPAYADQIALAGYRQDENFFRKLSNALTSTGVNKREQEYDSLRFALYLLEVEEDVLSDLSQDQAYQLFCLDLKIYPDHGDIKKLWQFISRWKKSRST